MVYRLTGNDVNGLGRDQLSLIYDCWILHELSARWKTTVRKDCRIKDNSCLQSIEYQEKNLKIVLCTMYRFMIHTHKHNMVYQILYRTFVVFCWQFVIFWTARIIWISVSSTCNLQLLILPVFHDSSDFTLRPTTTPLFMQLITHSQSVDFNNYVCLLNQKKISHQTIINCPSHL